MAAMHVSRLHVVAGLIAQRQSAERALSAVRPPLFGRDRDRLRQQAGRWSRATLGDALDRLIRAELACKQTGAPDTEICRETLLHIAAGAGRRKNRANPG